MTFCQETTLPKTKDAAYVMNLDNKKGKETHWVSLSIYKNTPVYFDSFGIEYICQKLLKKIKYKSISHKIFKTQDNDSIMCGFYCIAFIRYILTGKIC